MVEGWNNVLSWLSMRIGAKLSDNGDKKLFWYEP